MRSARTIPIGLALLVAAGCTTTQQKAAWLRLNSARLRASELAVRVTAPSRVVTVSRVRAVPGKDGAAVVVEVRNLGSRTLSDLPISVGVVAADGKREYLNAAPGLDYFQTHLPAVPAHRQLDWVYTTGRRLAAGAQLFAAVGRAAAPAAPIPPSLPQIEVLREATRGARDDRGVLGLTVVNHSSVTQYQLPVYAVAPDGRAYAAAGEATIGELTGGGSARLRLRLVGVPGTNIDIEAAPTIFQ